MKDQLALFATICLSLPAAPALADACRDQIAALYDGPLDPFQRPPHRQEVQMYDAEGNATRLMSNTIETPLRTIAGETATNYFTMVIDRDMWNGPSPEGPWTSLGMQTPDGREEGLRRAYAEQRENLTDTVCHGTGDDGLIRYTYRTKTDLDANGVFYGGLDTITIDPVHGQIVRFEMTDFVNSWSEGVSKERHDIEVIFDPTIKVTAPR